MFSKFSNAAIPEETNGYADDYPFSVPVTKGAGPNGKLLVQDLIDIQRDHYEGTRFSLTEGVAAGPYGDPNRYDLSLVDNMTVQEIMQGEFAR